MNFDHISSIISSAQITKAQDQFTKLIVDLGLRDTNYHCGSGLGGNNFQLLVLLNMKHELIPRVKISVGYRVLYWGDKFLEQSNLEEIRLELDKIFDKIVEDNKYLPLAFQAMLDPTLLRNKFLEYKEHFPNLTNCLEGKSYRFDSSLSNLERLLLANLMCQELVSDLDKNDRSRVQIIGAVLQEFSPEMILMSVRIYIGIDRVIKYDLDEDPVFAKAIKKVLKVIS